MCSTPPPEWANNRRAQSKHVGETTCECANAAAWRWGSRPGGGVAETLVCPSPSVSATIRAKDEGHVGEQVRGDVRRDADEVGSELAGPASHASTLPRFSQPGPAARRPLR